ncbi:tripartite tricarboxylate transporter substrate binding protein [Devosia sp. Root436]|uniref:Bug family tripartite tricarboxylate transporter substrate binding protein n=1 Tax=Devosia sp. Root436 TaxID=1736537 RepID=UPI00138F66E4|nr:tripartite tricarboxylate transporter substrate binding protein [Devosia sp. Root436]
MALATTLITISAASIAAAAAQDYPTGPIKLIIPYAPGGGTDAAAAVFSDKLGQILGQPIIKENHPGSNAVIGTALLAEAAPDGQTLMVVTGAIANNPYLYANLPFDTEELVPVSILTTYPYVLAVRSDLPFNNMQELIDYAKANPGVLTAGTPGRGAGAQLVLRLLNERAGIDIRDIPFKGAGESLNAVAGGFVDVVFSGYETVRPFVESGKMKFFAQSGTVPLGEEQIPPIADTLPGFEYQNWLALIAPPGTPENITDKLNEGLTAIFSEQEVKDRLASQNIQGIASTAEEAKAYLSREMSTSRSIIGTLGLQPE